MNFSVNLAAPPNVSISGVFVSAFAVDDSGLRYQAIYVMQPTDPEGVVGFLVDYMDVAGNLGVVRGPETLLSPNVTFGKYLIFSLNRLSIGVWSK
jgi:hypothetical protein